MQTFFSTDTTFLSYAQLRRQLAAAVEDMNYSEKRLGKYLDTHKISLSGTGTAYPVKNSSVQDSFGGSIGHASVAASTPSMRSERQEEALPFETPSTLRKEVPIGIMM